jgi:hypothetical protein
MKKEGEQMSVVVAVVGPHRLKCEDVNYEVSGDYECGQPVAWLHSRDNIDVYVCQDCYTDYYSKN